MSEEEGMMFMMSVQGLSKKKQQNGISAGDPIGSGRRITRSDRMRGNFSRRDFRRKFETSPNWTKSSVF